MNQHQQQAIAAIQQSFNDVVAQTKLKPAEVCRALLAGTVSRPDPVDHTTCQVVPQGEFVNVTFSTPVTNVPASLSTYKYRNPNNCATFDAQGNWTGVVAYFREWEGFIEGAREHIYSERVHEANL